MPSGIPVATVAINGGANAGILAAKILATSDPELLDRVKAYSAGAEGAGGAEGREDYRKIGYKAYIRRRKMDYKKAGVDIEAGYRSVELMKEHVKQTMREEVLGGLGGFSGAFSLAKIKEMEEPVLLVRYRWLRHEGEAGISSWTSMIPSVLTP